jgi:hypothetical protein
MILVQAGQSPLVPMKMLKNKNPRPIELQNSRITTKLIAERIGVGNDATKKILERD